MEIVNLTPHTITLIKSDGETFEISSSGVIRAKEEKIQVGEVNGFPIYRVSYGKPEGLPEVKDGELYIVSLIAYNAIKEHYPQYSHKFFIVADTVRDNEGRIIGAKGLAQP